MALFDHTFGAFPGQARMHPLWTAMTILGAAPGCIGAFVLGFPFGRKWRAVGSSAVLLGLIAGFLSALAYWILAIGVETVRPGRLDPASVGTTFAILCFAAPICGAIGASLGFKWPNGRRSRDGIR